MNLRSDDFRRFCLSLWKCAKRRERKREGEGREGKKEGKKGRKREKRGKRKKERKIGGGLVIRDLKSHRISAYRFLPIGEGRAVGKIEANGKKEGGKKGKGYK